MTWLVWRQYRNQAYFAAAALAVFAVLLLVTGRQMASQYHSALTSCATSHTCGNLANTLTLGTPVLFLLVTLTVVVPCLLGVFWGGPLVARELQTGTSQFAWMQSITRSRWLTVKAGWALLAAAAWGGAVPALVTWWSSPVNALNQQNFQPGQFDIQGIVPVGYALFAVALGITAGTLLRRTLPALAVTVSVFAAPRIVVADYLRPHYMTALTRTYNFLHGPFLHRPAWPTGSYWLVSGGVVGPGGQVSSSQAQGGPVISINGVPISNLPNMSSACRALVFQDPLKLAGMRWTDARPLSIVGVKRFLDRRQQRTAGDADKSAGEERQTVVPRLTGMIDSYCDHVWKYAVAVLLLEPLGVEAGSCRGWECGPVVEVGRPNVVPGQQIGQPRTVVNEFRYRGRRVDAVCDDTKAASLDIEIDERIYTGS